MAQYAFYFDNARCTGCKTCVLACKDKKNLNTGEAYRRVYEYAGGATEKSADAFATTCFAYTVSVACNHCDSPVCYANCPQGAIEKDPETGFVSSDPEKCIGCGTCANVCPYGAPHVNEETKKSVKCDGCADLVAAGGKPACVTSCPARALNFGEADAMAALGERADIAPLPSVSETTPNLFIKASADARGADSSDGEVANSAELA
ncbi:4Fe-4S dicluster domain-containing protein [Adlercreutzia equolifaciens]|uniref:4Fe-4S dicluster domain-containing protein n=1 Tax=Adlercreutzia equolifaciens TaxID=446660 RepID=UPI0023B02A36|nr:4Fe-4S dicluster domain-containing protein [Adlercreutzia equolifaciens]MDE8701544.1 4Fe-4S dicluster domain-containing protein [Adlercreutzia equolifaciens]